MPLPWDDSNEETTIFAISIILSPRGLTENSFIGWKFCCHLPQLPPEDAHGVYGSGFVF